MESKFAKQAQKLQVAQTIEQRVIAYLEEKKKSFVTEKREAVLEKFPRLTELEVDALLPRYAKPGLLFNNIYRLRDDMIEMPEEYKSAKEEQPTSKESSKDIGIYQQALKVPAYYRTAECALSILPKKNDMLALQVINRLAREYEIRFEDVETVFKECLV